MTSEIKVNTINKASGSTLTLGGCGTAVTLASGATQSGFGRTGSVNWQTTPKTSNFTAVSGEGYFINSSSAITVSLPAGSAGAIVAFSDYARNFATYNLTISPNGSEKIGGQAYDAVLRVDGQSATFVYVDSTKGWVNVQNAEDTETGEVPAYISATGGTITTVCTNYKVHTFTSPGTFAVSSGAGNLSKADYLVVAGGAGGGGSQSGFWAGGGGGAGGFRESRTTSVSGCWTTSPLVAACASLSFSPGSYPVTVGAGGSAGTGHANFASRTPGGSGSSSVLSSITSAGGGGGSKGGGPGNQTTSGIAGGSGGGTGGYANPPAGGAGNTPPTTPAQGQNGGTGTPCTSAGGGGGGGAGGVGGNGGPGYTGGAGGNAVATHIPSSPISKSQGGAAGGTSGTAAGGPANSGNGGQGGMDGAPLNGATGGSGIVVIRYRFQ